MEHSEKVNIDKTLTQLNWLSELVWEMPQPGQVDYWPAAFVCPSPIGPLVKDGCPKA